MVFHYILTLKDGTAVEAPFLSIYTDRDKIMCEIAGVAEDDVVEKELVFTKASKFVPTTGTELLPNQRIERKKSYGTLDPDFPEIPSGLNLVRQRSYNFTKFASKITKIKHLFALYFVEARNSLPPDYSNLVIANDMGNKKQSPFTFFTIKTQKGKVRFVCSVKRNKKEIKEYYKNLKDILFYMSELDRAMYGVGKGVSSLKGIFDPHISLKLDLKDFFNNVRPKQIRKGLDECLKFNLNTDLAKKLSLVLTPKYERFMFPKTNSYEFSEQLSGNKRSWQGLPTSTIAAYIAFMPVFKKIIAKCDNKNNNIFNESMAKEIMKNRHASVEKNNIFNYALYIDDLVITMPKMSRAKAEKELSKFKRVISDNGFKVNEKKAKVLYGNKQFFLGVNLETEALGYNAYVKKLKIEMHRFIEKLEKIEYKKTKDNIGKPEMPLSQMILFGKIQYLKSISVEQYIELKRHHKYGEYVREIESRKLNGIANSQMKRYLAAMRRKEPKLLDIKVVTEIANAAVREYLEGRKTLRMFPMSQCC